MKQSTEVWAKFESVGKPESTKVVHASMREVVIEYGRWMNDVYMGTHIRLTMARTETELNMHTNRTNKSMADEDMEAELVALMSQDNLGLEH